MLKYQINFSAYKDNKTFYNIIQFSHNNFFVRIIVLTLSLDVSLLSGNINHDIGNIGAFYKSANLEPLLKMITLVVELVSFKPDLFLPYLRYADQVFCTRNSRHGFRT